MSWQGFEGGALINTPQSDRGVLASNGQSLSIGTKADRHDPTRMTPAKPLGRFVGIPESNRLVICHSPTVDHRTERDRPNRLE